jgi:hypothetical protein
VGRRGEGGKWTEEGGGAKGVEGRGMLKVRDAELVVIISFTPCFDIRPSQYPYNLPKKLAFGFLAAFHAGRSKWFFTIPRCILSTCVLFVL